MRAFIGTFLARINQDALDAFGGRVADLSGRVLRPVPPRSGHFTHLFLGELDEPLTAAIARDLVEVMAEVAAAPFQLGRPELLCAGREPRLVLAHLEGGRQAVEAVTRAVVDRVRRQPSLGELAPSRRPHVTLARFRRGAGPRDAGRVAELLASAQIGPVWQPDCLAEVQLVRSELTPAGPIYEVVARARAIGPA